MADKKSTAESLARLAIEAFLAGGGAGARGILRGGLGSFSGRVNDATADGYPSMMHNFRIYGQPGPAMENRGNRIRSGAMDKAFSRMQSLEEHNNALSMYIREGQNPRERHAAIMRGYDEEQNLPAFWEDKKPRRDFHPSSSAVSDIRITPDNRIEVRWRTSPTWYTFRSFPNPYEASLAAQKLLTCESIGRAVFPTKQNGFRPIVTKKGKTLGTWNAENYDGSMAP